MKPLVIILPWSDSKKDLYEDLKSLMASLLLSENYFKMQTFCGFWKILKSLNRSDGCEVASLR